MRDTVDFQKADKFPVDRISQSFSLLRGQSFLDVRQHYTGVGVGGLVDCEK